jgi:3-hydroxyisobutyrate dehydrogenase
MAKIAFIGLGNMGAPMAANLLKAGQHVTGYDINETALATLTSQGGHRARSAAEAAASADTIITMLPAGEHVRRVMLHQGGLIDAARQAGTTPLLIDCSTIDVATAREVEAEARRHGLTMLDAPVSGGTAGAAAGTLTFMVGGSEAGFARAEPILQAMGRNIVHAGGPGAGQAAKICNNMIIAINMIGVCEGFILAQKLGLDWQKLWDITSTATARSWALNDYCPAPGPVPNAPSNRDYAPGFMAALMLKDLGLSQQAAEQTNSPTPLGAHATALYAKLIEAGEGTRDFSVIFRWLAAQSRDNLM